jgi:YVTN family beta-propeller protein
MGRFLPCFLLLCLPLAAQQAPIPTATELPSDPFFVKKSWPIGGVGNWDYLTLDPAARRLYIAHGPAVQVLNLDSGSLVGEIPGFREAHAIALDDVGTFGYVSDGPANAVMVFNRSSLEVEATIPVGCSPRSVAFEPQNKLVFAVCGAALADSATQARPSVHAPSGRVPRPGSAAEPVHTGESHVLVIDAQSNSEIADIMLDGDLRFAQPDADGHVYISAGAAKERRTTHGGATWYEMIAPRIARIDANGIQAEARRHGGAQSGTAPAQPAVLDWSEGSNTAGLLRALPLPPSCEQPAGLAVDSRNLRLFAACGNQQMLVLNSANGQVVTALTTGPGDDMLAYDAGRGLIFVANGGGYGSLTIVRQDANTDSYAVVQNLPTLERARTLAVDASTGEVYLVTDLHGVDLTKTGGIGTLHFEPIAGSFQAIVIGH